MTDSRYTDLLDTVKEYSQNFKLNFKPSHVARLVEYAMKAAETKASWSTMTGREKKDYVVGVVTEVVSDLLEEPEVRSRIPDDVLPKITAALDAMPDFIDAAVSFKKFFTDVIDNNSNGDKKGGCCTIL